MTRTLADLYDTFAQARAAADALARLGVPEADVAVVSLAADRHDTDRGLSAVRADDTTVGVEAGLALGGVVGLAAGIGIVAMPMAAPLLAAGWLAVTAAGAVAGMATGTLVGGLVGHGHAEGHAQVLAEGVRRGCTLVTARVPLLLHARAREAMQRNGRLDPQGLVAVWRREGWAGYDPAAPDLTPEQVVAERRGHAMAIAA